MNIDTLPAGREMDALIHERVRGLTDHAIRESDGTLRLSWLDAYGFEDTLYSTDIAAAWPLAEEFRLCVVPRIGGGWNAMSVEILSVEGPLPSRAGSDYLAPLAICRAVLKVVDARS